MDSTQVLLVHLLVLSLVGAGAQDLNSDRAALLALREAVGRAVLPWQTAATPCSWRGVSCRYGRVAALRLPGSGLIGQIPESTVGNLTGLRTLSLRLNAISGPLPSDLSQATELRNLYLQGNRFSGEFPSSIVSLPRLIHLNLADNELTGEIPAVLNNLTRITTLFLENNDLSGSIPDLDLPSLTQLNVSFNNLSGSIPARLRKMPASAYLGMKKLCGGPLGPCPGEAVPSPAPAPAPTTLPATKPVPVGPTSGGGAIGPGGDGGGNGNSNNASSGGSSKLSGGAIAGIAVGSALGLLLLLALLIFMCRRKRDGESKTRAAELSAVPKPLEDAAEPGRNDNRAADSGAAVGAAIARGENGDAKKLVFLGGKEGEFDLEELLRASAEVLGKGTFGTTYKAILEMGAVVAVKRLRDVTLVEPEFQKRIEAIGVMDHPNLVSLRAYYHSKDEKLLVYDYMPMGSLSALLHGNSGSGRTPLNWETRSGVALATARGIAYIHSTGPDASHGNIKSSNILLDKSKDARVSDYGLAHFVISSSPTRGSGYRAPEATDAQKVSQKADVYSFGVLLLELLTGKAPSQAILSEEGVDLPRWVQSVVREEWTSEVFDPELLRYQSVEEMEQLLQLAIDCAAQYPDKRPSMAEVEVRIEEVRRSSLGPRDQKQKLHQQHTIDDGDDRSSRHTESS